MNAELNYDQSLASILVEIKNELQEFVQTGTELFKCGPNRELACFKAAVPMISGCAPFVFAASFIFSATFILLFAHAFGDSRWHWSFASLNVCVASPICGVTAALAAVHRMKKESFVGRKIVAVLGADKKWIQNATRKIA